MSKNFVDLDNATALMGAVEESIAKTRIFHETTQTFDDWDALTPEEQARYSFIETPDGVTVAVADAVTDGDMRPVTSNAVYDEVHPLANDLGNKSSASAVSGNNAFSKINTLNEVLTKHELDNPVTLTDGVDYTVPADGYIKIVNGSTSTTAQIKINGVILTQFHSSTQGEGFVHSMFVRKGMVVNGTGTAGLSFYALK